MSATYHTVKIEVRVYDRAELLAAAVARAISEGMSEADARDLLTTDADEDEEADAEALAAGEKVPDLNACLIMLFDPGMSPDGCEIQGTSTELDSLGEAADAFL